MKKILVCLLFGALSTAYAQMSESEVSDMCMNQIVAGMAQDKILGGNSGICVKFTKDSDGNINGMDFKMNTSAFELGKDQLQDDEQKRRIQTIKDFVVNYQQLVTKNEKLNINDIDIQVRSYADGVAGPSSFDNEIKAMSKWSDVLSYIGEDKAGVKHLMQNAPQSKNLSGQVNFGSLPAAAQSTIRNIVLAKKRSQSICREFGIKDCNRRENSGFSSPDLEKRNKEQRNCDDRRVSVISVNLDKAATAHSVEAGSFHPSFGIPSGERGDAMKMDMQIASSFEIIRQHNETIKKMTNSDSKKEFRNKISEQTKSHVPAERVKAARILTAIDSFKENTFGILDLPEDALNSSHFMNYAGMAKSFGPRYTNFIKDLQANFPELVESAKNGDFYSFKEKAEEISDTQKKDKFTKIQSSFLNYGTNPTTDFFNYFSTSEALKYHYASDPNNANLVSAATIMNQSNAELKIKLDYKDLRSAKNKNHDDGRAHWMCYGGCQSGIHENENGEFHTQFRNTALKTKSADEMHKEFGSVPLGFGALKTLSVYVINDCSNCDCLKQRNVRMEDILNGPNAKKVAITKVTKQANGERGFSESVGKIANPANTCIFTPPVAHTCKVDPSGTSEGDLGLGAPKTNYSCAMWDKSSHGLKWTLNFVKDGLGLTDMATDFHCAAKSKTLKELAKGAICDFTDPQPVPDTCK